MNINLITPEQVSLKDHTKLTKSWLQYVIAKDPDIIEKFYCFI